MRLKDLLLIFVMSLGLHGGTLGVLMSIPHEPKAPIDRSMKVALRSAPKPKPKIVPKPEVPLPKPEQKKTPPPPPPKPKPKKPKEKPKSMGSKSPQSKAVKPVLGLNPNSVNSNAKSNFQVPLGNTTMIKDQGIVLSPEQVKSLEKNLSRDAKLLRATVKVPEKTEEALDAGLVGRYVVDVYVDAKGVVTSAELSKKIGFGMDPLVLAAARSARFEPRYNAKGLPIAGWTKIVFRFTD